MGTGRTHGKDIMLLCKGWYNENEHHTLLDALRQYYKNEYTEQYGDISINWVNSILLKPAIEELISENNIRLFISYILEVRDIPSLEKTYEEILYNRLTSFLSALKVMDTKNDIAYIELEAYDTTVRSSIV